MVSFAILSDGSPKWRPAKFGHSLLGSTISFEFPITKLLDYQDQWTSLVGNDNPFATVVMAHLKTLETQRDPTARYNWKFYLIRRFYERGYSRQDVLNLLHFIDWLMQLPQDLEEQLRQEVYQLEAGKAMPYISSFERLAKEEGHQKGLLEGREKGLQEGRQEGRQEGLQQAHQSALRILSHILEHRFGEVPQPLAAQLANLSTAQLEDLVDGALTATVLDEFAAHVATLETQSTSAPSD